MIGSCGNFVHSKTFWLECAHCGASESAHRADAGTPAAAIDTAPPAALDSLSDIVQKAIYHTRWVASFGRDSKIPTDAAIAEAVLAAITEAGRSEWVIFRVSDDGNAQPFDSYEHHTQQQAQSRIERMYPAIIDLLEPRFRLSGRWERSQ